MSGGGSKRWDGVLAWLLCLLLVFVAVDPPHCDLCDAIPVASAATSHMPIAKHLHSAPADDCNGLCSCCDFHGMPAGYGVTMSVGTIAGMLPVEPPSVLFALQLSLFRPPRMLSL